jgi:aminoglycoside/choline kinase family phosphotransferase
VDAETLERVVHERLGRRPASIESIEAGLGNRRFHRLHFREGEPRTLIARSEPIAGAPAPVSVQPGPALRFPPAPAWLPEPPLEPLRGFLESAGLRVPRSHGHHPDIGLDLLEDVGATNLLRAPASERERHYRAACGFVPRLQRLTAPAAQIPAFGRRYDRALVESKGWKWIHWTIPGLLGRPASEFERRETSALFAAIADALEQAPRRLAHRDFKAENLHLLAASGGEELVLIDVQGAFVAPPEYDLACLLYDLQADLDEGLVNRLFAETIPMLPDRPTPDEARRRFDAIAVARLAKDVSHVVQAGLGRGDRRRWHEIPRGLSLLERAAGRLAPAFPGISTLKSVIHALTTAYPAADIAGEGTVR